MENPVIIFGAGELGALALEIFKANNVMVYGFLDDNAALKGTEIDDVPVLGSTDDEGFLKLIGKKCEAFVALEETVLRKKAVEYLLEVRKVMPCNCVHPQAVVSTSAEISHGIMVGQGVVIGPKAKIANHVLLHAGAVIDYSAQLEEFVQVRAGATVGNGASIEKEAYIGHGATIVPGIKVGKKARVGAGSVVVGPVAANETVFGVPAVKV